MFVYLFISLFILFRHTRPTRPTTQQLSHAVHHPLTPPTQTLTHQQTPVVHDGDDLPPPLVLNQNVNELATVHLVAVLSKNERVAERPLQIVPHPNPVAAVVLGHVVGVLDEVPSALRAPVPVAAKSLHWSSEPPPKVNVLAEPVERGVEQLRGTHTERVQLLEDEEAAHGREGSNTTPKEEAGAGSYFLQVFDV